jgi:hypothetical protein
LTFVVALFLLHLNGVAVYRGPNAERPVYLPVHLLGRESGTFKQYDLCVVHRCDRRLLNLRATVGESRKLNFYFAIKSLLSVRAFGYQ